MTVESECQGAVPQEAEEGNDVTRRNDRLVCTVHIYILHFIIQHIFYNQSSAENCFLYIEKIGFHMSVTC